MPVTAPRHRGELIVGQRNRAGDADAGVAGLDELQPDAACRIAAVAAAQVAARRIPA